MIIITSKFSQHSSNCIGGEQRFLNWVYILYSPRPRVLRRVLLCYAVKLAYPPDCMTADVPRYCHATYSTGVFFFLEFWCHHVYEGF